MSTSRPAELDSPHALHLTGREPETREPARLRPGSEPQRESAAGEAAPPSPGPVPAILDLQRTAGNRAASVLVQRDDRSGRGSKRPPRGGGAGGSTTATASAEVESWGTQIIRGAAGKGKPLDMTPGRPTKLLKGDTAVLSVTFASPEAKGRQGGGMELAISGEGVDVTRAWKTDRRHEWSLTFTSVGKSSARMRAGDPPVDERSEFTIVAEGDELIPTQAILGQQAVTWIEQVWGALNQGLADFEKNAQVTDWNALALSVIGNVIWATASFATGGAAFIVSLAGIAVGTKATASAVTSLGDFHNAARQESDALQTALKARVPKVVDDVHGGAIAKSLGGRETYRLLIERLLKPAFIDEGPIASVNSPRIAALTERELILRAGSSPSSDWAGWKHGNWWVEYAYRVDGAMEPPQEFPPFSQWRLSRDSPDARLYPIDTDVRQARDRLNEVQRTVGGPHRVRDWPLRKVLKVYVRGSRALTVTFDGGNRIQSVAGEYLDPSEMQRLLQAAGGTSGRGLVDWVWSATGGQPPDIDRLR